MPTKIRNSVMLNQTACIELAQDKRLGGAEFRVFYALLSLMDYEDSVQISQADICEMIGMKQKSVSAAIKTLIEADVLRSIDKPGQTTTYILNPYYVSRSNTSSIAMTL
jgi:phage replication O-like protein O